jgi:prepilin-type N-terminal cleavage/methylation domain-containing protein
MFGKLILKLFSRRKLDAGDRGFTLTELLVAMFVSTLIVSGLLAFLVNILQTDRREQVKVDTQQDLQAAMDFIADDLQESIYVYDADGLEAIMGGTISPTPGTNQLPDPFPNLTATPIPILLFWKRSFYDRNETVTTPTGTDVLVGCIKDSNASCNANNMIGADEYTYSLVAYFVTKNDPTSGWSGAARLLRWELRGGILSDCPDNLAPNGPTTPNCNLTAQRGSAQDPNDLSYYYVLPDAGFRRFDLTGAGSLKDRMANWQSAPYDFTSTAASLPATQEPQALMDYVDDTLYDPTQEDPTVASNIDILVGPDGNINGNECEDPATGQTGANAQRVPRAFDFLPSGTTIPTNQQVTGFYACVNSLGYNTRVFLRGNALARIASDIDQRTLFVDASGNVTARRGTPPTATSPITSTTAEAFVPTSDIQVRGRGALGDI